MPFPPLMPLTDQATDVSAALETVDVKVKVLPVWTVAVLGWTATVTAEPMFKVMVAVAEVSAKAAAVINTDAGFGGTAGAV